MWREKAGLIYPPPAANPYFLPLQERIGWQESPAILFILVASQTFAYRRRGILPPGPLRVRLLGMHTIARLLQLVGMAIAPLAMVAQLGGSISVGDMLKFLLLSVGIFVVGYTLQRYSGSSQ